MTQDQIQAELESLKSQLAQSNALTEELKKERDALKASGAETPPDLEGLKRNRDELLAEKKKLAAEHTRAMNELEALKAEKQKAHEAALLEQNKYKELWELQTKKSQEIEAKLIETKKTNNFKDAAILKIQPKYLPFVLPLANSAEYDSELKPTNIDQILEGYKAQYPEFFSQTSADQQRTIANVDGAKTTITGTNSKPYTRAEIKAMTPDEFKKNEAEIDKQAAAGLIK